MKILINTDQIYRHGGIEKVMATKVNYWSSLPSVEVFIVTTEQDNQPPCYAINRKVKLIDLEINYNRSKSYLSFENLEKAIQHFFKQKLLFKKIKPDVIISPNLNFDHYWLPFIKKDVKLIKERHSSRYLEADERIKASFLAKLKFQFTDWIDAKYNHIVVLNSDEANYVYTNNAVVIPNPMDSTDLYTHLNNKQVLAAGRIAPVKGFNQLIEAWRIIHQQAPDWQLHIYGDNYGTTQNELEALVQKYNLQNVVIFKGTVNNLPEKMIDYNIYVLSSVTECFPTVLLEALNVGLPSVAYDCPNGPRHIITNQQDGLLAINQNPKDLAKQVLYLIKDIDLQIKFRNNAKQNSVRFCTKRVMKLWDNLLNL